jgi:hypothetical protein
MNNKILTIAALAAVLVAGVFATTPMAAYAGGDDGDSSETDTEQSIKQKNSGGDGSTNVNCADNDLNSPSRFDVQLCGTAAVDLGVLDGMDAGRAPE